MSTPLALLVSFLFGVIAGKLFFSKTTVIKVSNKKSSSPFDDRDDRNENADDYEYYKGTRNSADEDV